MLTREEKEKWKKIEAQREKDTKELLRFHQQGKKVLDKGKVFVQGEREEREYGDGRIRAVTRLPQDLLYFKPNFFSKHRGVCFDALKKYLKEYIPMTERGMVFYPEADYHLERNDYGIRLFLTQDKVDWCPSEALEVYNYSRIDKEELEKKLSPLVGGKVSSFVFGRVKEMKDFDNCRVVRIHYKE